MRAERLGALGLLQWIEPSALSPGVLAAGIEDLTELPRHELAGRIGSIGHRGIYAAAQNLAALLPTTDVAEANAARARTSPATVEGHASR